MNKIWAVHSNWVSDTVDSSNDVYLYSSYESAKKSFNQLVKQDKEEYFEGRYDVEDSNYEWEETEDYWNIWETGYYASNHSEIFIKEHIVED